MSAAKRGRSGGRAFGVLLARAAARGGGASGVSATHKISQRGQFLVIGRVRPSPAGRR